MDFLERVKFPVTHEDFLARVECKDFDRRGLYCNGTKVHVRMWNPVSLKDIKPRGVTLDVVFSEWPGVRGLRLSVLSVFGESVAYLAMGGRNGDDFVAMHEIDTEGVAQAILLINGHLQPFQRSSVPSNFQRLGFTQFVDVSMDTLKFAYKAHLPEIPFPHKERRQV